MPPRASASPLPADRRATGGQLQLLPPPSQFRPGQLPLTVRPLPGELPISWFARAAHRFGITPRALLQATGMIRQTASTTAALRRAQAPVRLRILGLSPGEADELAAPHPAADALRRNLTLYKRRTGRVERSAPRYCPACLATNTPHWPKSWQVSTTLVCTEHHLALLPTCPACGSQPFSRADWLTTTTAIYQCPHALPDDDRPGRRVRRRCQGDLRTAPADAVTEDDVTAQRLLDTAAAAAPNTLMPTCGTRVEAVILFGAILDLTGRLTAQGMTERAARTRAVTALATTSPAEAAEHLGPLEQPVKVEGIANPLAHALRLETTRTHLSPTRQLSYRAARAFLAQPLRDGQRPRKAHTLPEHRTPRPSLTELREAELPPITDTDGTPLPTDVVRLLTARLGRPGSWATLAKALDLPSDIALTISATLRSLQRQDAWLVSISALENHIHELTHT